MTASPTATTATHRFSYLRVVDGTTDAGGVKAVDLLWLASSAAEEFLQGSPMAPAFVQLFRSHLTAQDSWLRWAGDLAASAEMRRALSSLYGRIAARALLTHRLGVRNFVSLNRNLTPYAGLMVERARATRRGRSVYVGGDIPDWIAIDPAARRVVLCEAKGALTGSANQFRTGTPTCVLQGKEQFDRVEVRRGSTLVATRNWVAANLWSTEARKRMPVSLLYDPPGRGEDIAEEAWPDVEAAARLSWLRSLLPGLGLFDADEEIDPLRGRFAVTIEAEPPDAVAKLRRILADARDPSRVGPPPVAPDQPHSVEGHRGTYAVGLVTATGMTFVRSRAELDIASARIAEERANDRPALLIGLSLDASRRLGGGAAWIADAGIVRSDGFALFDAGRVRLSVDPEAGGDPSASRDTPPR